MNEPKGLYKPACSYKMSQNRKKVEHKNVASHLQPDSPETVDLLKQVQISSKFTFYTVELVSR
jgi:hypothetical protein